MRRRHTQQPIHADMDHHAHQLWHDTARQHGISVSDLIEHLAPLIIRPCDTSMSAAINAAVAAARRESRTWT